MPSNKLTFGDRVLTYNGWNGYVGYNGALPYYNFTIQDTHDQVQTYIKFTEPDGTTGELTNPTGAGTATITTSLPEGTILTGYTISNTYYRNSVKQSGFGDFVSAKTTTEPRKKTFTATITGDSIFGTSNTQANNVSWTWTYATTNYPTAWLNKNGGCSRIDITPQPGKITINSCYIDGSAYCCRLISDSNSGGWYGATARTTASRNNWSRFPAVRIGAIESNTWKNVWQSANVNLTAGYYHSNNTWVGTASNGGQRGLKAYYLYNSNQGGDPGKNINNNFYQGTKNSTKTTSFNITGTGNNMQATNWNNQFVRIEATLGMFTGGINSDATKYPPNQVNSVNTTVKCSALLP